MKKILSILGTISLITSGSSNLMSCNKPNNNKKEENNKSKTLNPQEPPTNINLKLVDINWQKDRHKFENEFEKLNINDIFLLNLIHMDLINIYQKIIVII